MKKNKLIYLFALANQDELFQYLISTLKNKITTWEYFVNWQKVFDKVEEVEKELNILNYLIGKDNIEEEIFSLVKQYPSITKAFPYLLGTRDKSIQILVDTKLFLYRTFNFSKKDLSDEQIKELVAFLIKSGIGALLKDRRIRNFVDYVTGVEVGLDSNGRKNRGGDIMEDIVEIYVQELCNRHGLEYLADANATKIQTAFGIQIEVDKSSRRIDFVINNNKRLFFIETNFYGGGGSKLKSTAAEYMYMAEYWSRQKIEFIWITDGIGWKTTMRPLREYFDRDNYLLNLDMLSHNALESITL